MSEAVAIQPARPTALSAPSAARLLALLLPLALLAAAAIAVSGAIGVYHAGVELGIFEGFTTCTANSTGATTADIFRKIAGAPLIRCDQVQWSLLGISMAGWNAILSLGGAAIIVFLGARRGA
jgi:disulfide bond formation protein DsbB